MENATHINGLDFSYSELVYLLNLLRIELLQVPYSPQDERWLIMEKLADAEERSYARTLLPSDDIGG